MPILKTLAELKAFALETECPQCRSDATDLIYLVEASGEEGAEIDFDTDCEHGEMPNA